MLNISHSIPFNDETEDGKSNGLKVISLDRSKAATGNFSESNKIGEGGFGPVYLLLRAKKGAVAAAPLVQIDEHHGGAP